VNQLYADNGFADRQVVVMVSDIETMTVNLDSLLPDATAASVPTATPIIAGFDASAPFGQFNQSLILPFGAIAPTVDLVFADPAAIIFAGQKNLFVESTQGFLADCAFYANNANNFLNLATGLFSSFNQVLFAQLSGLGGLVHATVAINTDLVKETATKTEENKAEKTGNNQDEEKKKKDD
jgi:hypothetical protein